MDESDHCGGAVANGVVPESMVIDHSLHVGDHTTHVAIVGACTDAAGVWAAVITANLRRKG